MTCRYVLVRFAIVGAFLVAGCRSSAPRSQSLVRDPNANTSIRPTTPVAQPGTPAVPPPAEQRVMLSKEEQRKLHDNMSALEKALSRQTDAQQALDRKMENIRKDLYQAALTIRDIKIKADLLVGEVATNEATLAGIDADLKRQQAVLAGAGTGASASKDVQVLQAALQKEQDQREREQAITREKDKEVQDLRKALDARDELLKKQPAPTPAIAGVEQSSASTAAVAPTPPAMTPSSSTATRPPAPVPAATNVAARIKMVADANVLLRQGQVDQAARLYLAVLASDSSMMGAQIGLAACRYAKGDLLQAKQIVTGALKADPSNAQALGLRGIIYWREGDLDAASSALGRALKTDPDDSRLHNYMGIVLYDSKQSDEAIREMRKAVELDPGNAEAHYNLAVMLATARVPMLDEARQHYETAVSLGNARDSALDKILYGNRS